MSFLMIVSLLAAQRRSLLSLMQNILPDDTSHDRHTARWSGIIFVPSRNSPISDGIKAREGEKILCKVPAVKYAVIGEAAGKVSFRKALRR